MLEFYAAMMVVAESSGDGSISDHFVPRFRGIDEAFMRHGRALMRWRLLKATKDTAEPLQTVAFVALGKLSQLIAGFLRLRSGQACSYWAVDDVGTTLAGKILHCKAVQIGCVSVTATLNESCSKTI
jgi:hypothetical protein